MVPMHPNTVAELVEEARGSAEARNELVQRYQHETPVLAAAILNDPTEAEDLSQDGIASRFACTICTKCSRNFDAISS